MSQYEHLAIFRAGYDLALHMETVVHGFSRYHKYSLGGDLRRASRQLLDHIVLANFDRAGRAESLTRLRYDLESFKILVRLAHDAKAFRSTRQYLYIAEQTVVIIKQNEGWLRQTKAAGGETPMA